MTTSLSLSAFTRDTSGTILSPHLKRGRSFFDITFFGFVVGAEANPSARHGRSPRNKIPHSRRLVKPCACVHKCATIFPMLVSIEGIEKLAALSRIALSPEEKERMRSEFDAILGYVAAIQEVSAGSTGRSRSIVAQVNVMREDQDPHECKLHTDALLSAAPQREGNYIKVKKIL